VKLSGVQSHPLPYRHDSGVKASKRGNIKRTSIPPPAKKKQEKKIKRFSSDWNKKLAKVQIRRMLDGIGFGRFYRRGISGRNETKSCAIVGHMTR
jgi:hypothetical protein